MLSAAALLLLLTSACTRAAALALQPRTTPAVRPEQRSLEDERDPRACVARALPGEHRMLVLLLACAVHAQGMHMQPTLCMQCIDCRFLASPRPSMSCLSSCARPSRPSRGRS